MTDARDKRLMEFVQESIRRGIPLHQLEHHLDRLENVLPFRVASMAEPAQLRAANMIDASSIAILGEMPAI